MTVIGSGRCVRRKDRSGTNQAPALYSTLCRSPPRENVPTARQNKFSFEPTPPQIFQGGRNKDRKNVNSVFCLKEQGVGLAQNQATDISAQKPRLSHPLGCYVVGIALVLYLFFALLMVLITHLDLLPGLATRDLLRTHVLCGGFGMLGAATASMRKYYRVLITESTARASGKRLTRPQIGPWGGSTTILPAPSWELFWEP